MGFISQGLLHFNKAHSTSPLFYLLQICRFFDPLLELIIFFSQVNAVYCMIDIMDFKGSHVSVHPTYLALSWRTAAVAPGWGTQHQTGPPLLLHTATQTTDHMHTQETMRTTVKHVDIRFSEHSFPLCDPPCRGCRPALCTVGGPPPSCPQCTSAPGLNWSTEPGEDGHVTTARD